MKWDMNEVYEGAGTVAAGFAVGLWRWLSGGAARMDRREIKTLLTNASTTVDEIKEELVGMKNDTRGVAEDVREIRHEQVTVREELREHTSELHEHTQADDARFKALDERAQSNHKENVRRLEIIEREVKK